MDPTMNDYDDFLVDDTLFVGDLPSSVRETDIKTLLQHCMPLEMYIRREDDLIDNDEDSYLRFSSPKYADRAYTIYHGFRFTNGAALTLRMYRKPGLEPEAHGDILEIIDLAPESDDVHRIYDIFRPFGPLQLCISNGHGQATIQYFKQADSIKAVYETNGMLLDGKRITIIPVPKESDYATTPGDTPPSLSPTLQISPRQQSEDDRKEQAQKQSSMKPHIDFTNLYIKNMDPLITNEHLQALFGRFGRIISARVISHPTTKQSRGYGFVSFSSEDEAARALEEMNGQVVFSKPLYVSFHETKKGRNDNNNNNNTYNYTMETSPYHPQVNSIAEYQRDKVDAISYQQHIASPVINLPRKQDVAMEQRYLPSPTFDEPNLGLYQNKKKSLITVETTRTPLSSQPISNGISPVGTRPRIQQGHDLIAYEKKQQGMDIVALDYNDLVTMEPSPVRRRSGESIVSDKTSSLQHKKLTKAVIRCGACPKNRIPDVVDLLLTLSRKDRSLCLFNTDYLRDKVDLALDALDTFDNDDDGDDINSTSDGYTNTNLWEPSFESPPLPRATSMHYNPLLPNYLLPDTPPTSSLSDLTGPLSSNDIDTLLDSFASMPLITQKQNLGDIMWPHVKPLVKPFAKKYNVPGFSSKILVYLLDNLPLSELAHGINNTDWLKTRIDAAANALYPQ